MNPTPAEAVSVRDENALNDAAWKFIDNATGDIPAPLWNNLKAALWPAIQCYISATESAATQPARKPPPIYIESCSFMGTNSDGTGPFIFEHDGPRKKIVGLRMVGWQAFGPRDGKPKTEAAVQFEIRARQDDGELSDWKSYGSVPPAATSVTSAPTSSIAELRERFEAWVVTSDCPIAAGTPWDYPSVQSAWAAWQHMARQSVAAPESKGKASDAEDAARYRAWRDCALTHDEAFLDAIQKTLQDDECTPTAAEWDAAIDAARAQQQGADHG